MKYLKLFLFISIISLTLLPFVTEAAPPDVDLTPANVSAPYGTGSGQRTFSCTGAVTDPDGDYDEPSYEWTYSTNPQGTNPTTIDSGCQASTCFQTAQKYYIKLTAYDKATPRPGRDSDILEIDVTTGGNCQGSTSTSTGNSRIPNPLGQEMSTFDKIVVKVVDKILFIAGVIVLPLFLVYAGFLFLLAQGNSEKLKEAKTVLKWTMVGIVVVLSAELFGRIVADVIKDLPNN